MEGGSRTVAAALAAVVALATMPCAASAQLKVGARAGVNFATVNGSDIDTDRIDALQGFLGGLFVEGPLADIVGFELGAQYSQKGFQVNPAGTVTSRLKADYIDVPALLTVGVPGGESFAFQIYLGPTFSFLVRCRGEAGNFAGGDCADQTVKSFDLGGDVGAGIRFGMGSGSAFLIDGFYNFGFQSIDNTDSSAQLDIKNEVISVSAGIVLPVG